MNLKLFYRGVALSCIILVVFPFLSLFNTVSNIFDGNNLTIFISGYEKCKDEEKKNCEDYFPFIQLTFKEESFIHQINITQYIQNTFRFNFIQIRIGNQDESDTFNETLNKNKLCHEINIPEGQLKTTDPNYVNVPPINCDNGPMPGKFLTLQKYKADKRKEFYKFGKPYLTKEKYKSVNNTSGFGNVVEKNLENIYVMLIIAEIYIG